MEPKKYVIINKKGEFGIEDELFDKIRNKIEEYHYRGGYILKRGYRYGINPGDDKEMFMVYCQTIILGKRYIMDIELDGSFIFIKDKKYEKLAIITSEAIYNITKKTIIISYIKSFLTNEYDKIKLRNDMKNNTIRRR